MKEIAKIIGETVRTSLDSNSRTARLSCLIMVATCAITVYTRFK